MDRHELLKRFLGQYKNAKKRRKILQARLRDIQLDMNMPLSAVRYTDMPKGYGVSEGAAALAIRKAEIEQKLKEQEEIMLRTMMEVMTVIEHLPSISEERQIIELKYIDGWSWVKIAREVGYSRSSCFDKFNKGLDNLLEFKAVKDILNEFKI